MIKKNNMTKKAFALMLVAAMSTAAITGCGGTAKDESSASNESMAETTAPETEATNEATVDDLSAKPAYGANPEFALWTTIPYLVEDAQIQFTATVSANEDLTKFEIQCFFFEDQVATAEIVDGAVTITEDKTGFMGGFGSDIIQYALDQNIWLPLSASVGEYGVFNDPGDEPVAVNYVEDTRPLYVQAGVWEEDFERTTPALNEVAVNIKDENVKAYKQECATKGTVEAVEYDTYYYAKDLADGDALSHATPIKKTAYVYLPAGYDAAKEYNVLYLLHGGGDSAAKWFSQNDTSDVELGKGAAVNILDNTFANGDNEPFIVVTPGLYNDGVEGTQELTGYVETYGYELQDLMTVVEAKYSTYAKDATKEAFVASRDHRAFAGLSMGSMTTWHSAIANCIDVVSYFGNMSAGPSADVEEAKAYTTETIIPAIDKAASEGYKINMLLSMNGTHDMALPPHVETHKLLTEYASTSENLTVGENYDFIVSDGAHTFEAWNLYLYDMAKIFFK